LNHKPFQKKDGSRASLFVEERASFLPLPKNAYEMTSWKTAKVSFNYHMVCRECEQGRFRGKKRGGTRMRMEIKYRLPSSDVDNIIDFSDKYGTADKYCLDGQGYVIQSTYIYEWREYFKGLKGKLRLRNYINDNQNSFFIEEKVKFGIWGSKNRCAISKQEYKKIKNISDTKSLREQSCVDKLVFFRSSATEGDLLNLTIRYYRNAWTVKYRNTKFRLTVDKDIECYLCSGFKKIVPSDVYILEIKGDENIFFIIDYFYKEFGLHPEKFSKFNLGKNEFWGLQKQIITPSISICNT
jgi:hypothetical protein